jgi:hypothetical protein
MEGGTSQTPCIPTNTIRENILSNRSVGARLIRAARARRVHARSIGIITSKRRETVELLSAIGDVVGMATTELELGSGMELHGLKLFPSEVAVRITRIDDALHWTGEVIGERLGLCMGLIIRWNRSSIRVVAIEPNIPSALGEDRSQSSPTRMMAPEFDFHERFNTPSSTERSRRSSQASNPVDENSPFFQCTPSNIRDLPHVEGLTHVRPTRRPYSMQNRRRRDSGMAILRETAPTKVSLASVQRAIVQGGCKQNCLRDIPTRYLLDMRYNAWAHEFSVRSTWMRQMLVSFYTRMEGTRRDKFVTKLDGKQVCNACYALGVGYSQRRFKELKKDCLIYGRVTSIHGNTLSNPVRESTRMSAAEACFKSFVDEAGCPQPHRSICRKNDNEVVPLILLPMNTVKFDVFNYVNEEVKRICNGETISMSSFRRMWRIKYPHVQVPPFSRFSKCYHCWEYKCAMEGTTNADARIRIKELFLLHLRNQMEERRHYWIFKRSCYINPELYMCIIVDGMDQNTTMVPRMRQTVKNIEHRFVKTHLCGALVHGIGLYCDVWFGAHHKHDSNQVVSTLLYVIGDVLRRKGFLPPTLRIQADNCTRENKNIYMFALCATLVGLGIFQEVELSFLIVGHTHEDIDQRFSCISSTLKRSDVDSLKEMFSLIERGTSPTEAFVSARLLENVWDWKQFIIPHLLTGSDSLVGITFPHHMRFYMDNQEGTREVRVQHKHYCKDPWGPETGTKALKSLPSREERPAFANVFAADERELKALDDFIAYKERCIQRLQHEDRNRDAKVEAERLKLYLAEFPHKDRSNEHRSLLFWPSDVSNNAPVEHVPLEVVDNLGEENHEITAVDHIVAMLPNAEARGYFGPRRGRPSNQAVRRAQRTECNHVEERAEQRVRDESNHDPFPPFNPQSDISCGQFVALSIDQEESEAGVPFYVGKVIEDGKSRWRLKMKVCWYWPIVRGEVIDGLESNARRYTNCLDSLWEPSGESHSWIEKEACIFSWMDESERTMTGACRWRKRNVFGVQVESKIRILQSAKTHILEYIAMQTEAIDDDRLQAALNTMY